MAANWSNLSQEEIEANLAKMGLGSLDIESPKPKKKRSDGMSSDAAIQADYEARAKKRAAERAAAKKLGMSDEAYRKKLEQDRRQSLAAKFESSSKPRFEFSAQKSVKAKAAMLPWNKTDAVTTKSGTRTRNGASVIHTADMDYDLSSGWHPKRKGKWQNKAKKSGNVEKRRLLGTDGKLHEVDYYVTQDSKGRKVRLFDDTIHFHATENEKSGLYQQRMAQVELAFNAEGGPADDVIETDGCGHISKLEYSRKQQILKVTFANNGAVCCFFRVRDDIAGTLFAFAQTGRTDQNGKHLLGKYFWDYIRDRGHSIGAKFPFEYEKHGIVRGDGQRHVFRIRGKDAINILKTVFTDDTLVAKRLRAQTEGKDMTALSNEFVITLTDEEAKQLSSKQWADLAAMATEGKSIAYRGPASNSVGPLANYATTRDDYDAELAAKYSGKHSAYTSASHDISGNAVSAYISPEDEFFDKLDAASRPKVSPTAPTEIDRAKSLMYLAEKAQDEVEKQLKAYAADPFYAKKVHDIAYAMAQGKMVKYLHHEYDPNDSNMTGHDAYSMNKFLTEAKQGPAVAKMIKEEDPQLAQGMQSAYSPTSARHTDSYSDKQRLIRAAYGPGTLSSWTKQNVPAREKLRNVGRVWTIKELIDFATPQPAALRKGQIVNSIQERDFHAYKMYIEAQDWVGALNFLKDHNTTLRYVSATGSNAVKELPKQSYASRSDRVVDENGNLL